MGGRVEKHSNAKSKIIRPLIPQIMARAEKGAEATKGDIPIKTGRLRDSVHVVEKTWGAQIAWGSESEPAAVWETEFGNDRQDGHRYILKTRQIIERGA